jgi:hypothetical protein
MSLHSINAAIPINVTQCDRRGIVLTKVGKFYRDVIVRPTAL